MFRQNYYLSQLTHKLSTLRPPHTSRFFVGRKKIFTCRLVCGEFRQVCDKIGTCRAISDSTKSQNVWALSASVGGPRQFVGARAYLSQWGIVMRVTWRSVFFNMAEIDSAPSLNAVSRDKKSASVRQANVPTNFNPLWPRQKICSSTTKIRLVCGGL